MVTFEVTLDLAPIWDKMPFLKPGDFDAVAALALNDTAKNAEVDAVKHLRPLMGISAADLKQSFSIAPANPGHLVSELDCRGRPIQLIKFNPRADATGVAVRIGGHTEEYRHAFISTMPKTGHRGVYARKGRSRLPIRQVYGPSVPGMMARRDVLGPVAEDMRDRLVANLLRQADRRVRRNKGYGGRRQ